MHTPELHASSALATDILYFLASLFSCLLALLGSMHLAQPRHAPPPPLAADELSLKTYLEHNVLC